MAKFFGEIGYGETVESRPGVWEDVITEYTYFGDVVQNLRKLGGEEKVNSDLSVSNSISIVADAFANEHFHAIRYIKWAGALWTLKSVEVKSPRLILWLGGVYNGPTPPAPIGP